MAWLDLLIIVLIVLSVIIGYKRGLILTLFSIGSYIVAFIFSRRYYANLTNWIKNQFFITNKLNDLIGSHVQLKIPETNIVPPVEGHAQGIANFINQDTIKMPEFIQNLLVNNLEVQTIAQQTVEGIRNQIIDTIATLFLNVISMVVLFFLIKWTITILGLAINKVFELPVLGAFNQMLGGVLGGIRGIFLIIIMLFILIPISISSPQGIISISIEESYLVQFFLNNLVGYLLIGIGAMIL